MVKAQRVESALRQAKNRRWFDWWKVQQRANSTTSIYAAD